MAVKFPKWGVGLSFIQYFMVEVETGSSSAVTSVFICNRDARNFAHYIPEVFPEPEDKKAGRKEKGFLFMRLRLSGVYYAIDIRK